MHVQHEGEWHRRTPNLRTTACGELYHSQFCPTRREELIHPMCRLCFTPYELSEADKLETAKRQLIEETP
jgi:hypothetical protein